MFAMECEPGMWVAPWNTSAFKFVTQAELGAGRDLFQGGDGRDVVFSATRPIGTAPMLADNSSDLMCGWGGNDILSGDRDDDLNTFEESMHGGNGSDICDGDLQWPSGSNVSDLHLSCETHSHADLDVWGFINCTSNDDPLHEW
jgi:hypothetical protein